jgi:methionyl-tRNA synthetase
MWMPRHLVTSALSRSGGVGALENLAGSLLPADAYCRFLRARGEEVLFVSAGGEPCGQRHAREARLAVRLGLSLDAFGRRSSPLSVQQTQYFARRLEQEGYVEAREGGLFFLQSRLAAELRAHAVSPASPRWLDQGVEDRSITSELAGGVPVDRTGFEGIAYDSGFDTPIACIGATREWAEARGEPGAWRRWWCASEDVRHVQFMAGGEATLHAVCFPCVLIGSRDGWKLADAVKAFHRCAFDGEPFSSRPGAFGAEVLDLLATDCWRYGLLAAAPEAGEETYSWESLAALVNADLAGTLSGFVARALGFALERFGGVVPAGGVAGPAELELAAALDLGIEAIAARIAALEFRRAVAELRSAWSLGAGYLAQKRPWDSFQHDRDGAALTARLCVNLVAVLARLSAPLMPFTAERLLDALGVPIEARGWPARFEPAALAAGHAFGAPPPLFRQVEAAPICG